jgi:hypothetical protein
VVEPRDRQNRPVALGDLVDTVYGGDHHTLVVEGISEEHGHVYLAGSISIRVPATATSRRQDRNPEKAPRQATAPQPREQSRKGR